MLLETPNCNFIKKEALAQVFSCEFCEIFKNTFFTEHLRVTASESAVEKLGIKECETSSDLSANSRSKGGVDVAIEKYMDLSKYYDD